MALFFWIIILGDGPGTRRGALARARRTVATLREAQG